MQCWGHRTSWPRNPGGGYQVGPNITKNRHYGVRCYGLHRDGRCFPYEPLRIPVKQAILDERKRR